MISEERKYINDRLNYQEFKPDNVSMAYDKPTLFLNKSKHDLMEQDGDYSARKIQPFEFDKSKTITV